MKAFILNELLKPATHRVGGYIGTFLTASGMATPDVNLVLAAVPAVLGFAIDLVIRKAI